jgi:hypothetical protein
MDGPIQISSTSSVSTRAAPHTTSTRQTHLYAHGCDPQQIHTISQLSIFFHISLFFSHLYARSHLFLAVYGLNEFPIYPQIPTKIVPLCVLHHTIPFITLSLLTFQSIHGNGSGKSKKRGWMGNIREWTWFKEYNTFMGEKSVDKAY